MSSSVFLVSHPGSPDLSERERNKPQYVPLEVSTRFWRKIKRLSTKPRRRASDIFERALDLAIAEHERVHGSVPSPPAAPAPPLPPHRHAVVFVHGAQVYFYGQLAIGVTRRCALVGVGVSPCCDE